MSRAAEGDSAVQDLDFRSLGSQLSPLAVVSACRYNFSLYPYNLDSNRLSCYQLPCPPLNKC